MMATEEEYTILYRTRRQEIPRWLSGVESACQTRDQTWASCITCRFFTIWVTREAPYVSVCLCIYVYVYIYVCVCVCVCIYAQSCPAVYNPMYCSLPGSSAHGILQAQILEWVSIPFSRESSWGAKVHGVTKSWTRLNDTYVHIYWWELSLWWEPLELVSA